MLPCLTLSPLECSEGESEPCAEGPGVFEPGELVLLKPGRRRSLVDSLEASDGVDPLAPPAFGGLVPDEGLEPPLVLQLLPHGVDVVREDLVVGPLLEAYGVDPCPMGGGPVAPPLSGGSGFAEDQAVPEQELRQPLLAALQVVPCVVQRAHQVARRLAFVIGNPDLDDVSHGKHPGEKLGVVAVVLSLPVGRGLDHLRNRADDAVDAQRRELLLQVEPGDAGLVNALWQGRGSHPFGDGCGVVGEWPSGPRRSSRPGRRPLSSGRASRPTKVVVFKYESPSACGGLPPVESDTRHCRPNPRELHAAGLSMFFASCSYRLVLINPQKCRYFSS